MRPSTHLRCGTLFYHGLAARSLVSWDLAYSPSTCLPCAPTPPHRSPAITTGEDRGVPRAYPEHDCAGSSVLRGWLVVRRHVDNGHVVVLRVGLSGWWRRWDEGEEYNWWSDEGEWDNYGGQGDGGYSWQEDEGNYTG